MDFSSLGIKCSPIKCGCYDFNNCTFITSLARPLPMTLTPTTSNAGERRITVITQVLLYSRPSFQFCKLSQLANSDIQINQLPLARCIVFSQFFKLLSKMFTVCWALNNIKRGTNDLTHPASCPVHNQQIFNTDILNFMFVICNNKPQEVFESLISIICLPRR